jgi:hypothetical protein
MSSGFPIRPNGTADFERRLVLRCTGKTIEHGRVGRPWSHRVDAHACRGRFEGRRFRQALDGMFAGGVDAGIGRAFMAVR